MINIKIDSRKVEYGDTFVAIKGKNVDGHDYIESAIENGAVRVIVDHPIDCDVETIVVSDTEKWLTEYVSSEYADLINQLNIIGITGTNGKTTSAYLTYQLLNKLGTKTAYIGTIGFYIPDEETIELPNTTPNILDLYELLLSARSKNCQNIVMEVSSHALDQQRIKGINFSIAAFTNLTQDHLDYHKTMDNYFGAKKLILKQLNGKMIINADDSYANKWNYKDSIFFGKKASDYQIINSEDTINGTDITFEYSQKQYLVHTNLKSEFNVYNFMTALCICNQLGCKLEDIINISESINPPAGRCEKISVRGAMAIVDYAHTPDAVEKIIEAFSQNKKGKIITLIGCGGDRDPQKRPIMGKIATELSDYVIFTSDNPRTEDPQKIMDDILSGVDKNNYEVILDRREAIIKALDLLENNDCALILGKGHEDYQVLGTTKVHLSDKEEILNYCEKVKK